jgi:hypothetical protein
MRGRCRRATAPVLADARAVHEGLKREAENAPRRLDRHRRRAANWVARAENADSQIARSRAACLKRAD